MSITESKKYHEIGGLILAGGASKRFESNKALFKYNGQTLIERTVNAIRPLFSEILISSNEPAMYNFLGVPVCRDIHTDMGPLAGIHSGLEHTSKKALFVVACDMPHLKPAMISHMCGLLNGYDVAVPFINGFYEPLFAVYSKKCLLPITKMLSLNQGKINKLYSVINLFKIEVSIIQDFDPDLKSFININTKEDINYLISN